MNLNQLICFYLTAKHKSPSAAAEILHVSPPAVTTSNRRFEDSNDVKLFQKNSKVIQLTEVGKALYKIAEKVFEMEQLAEDCIQKFQIQNEQVIRIHASETFGAYYLPNLINRFNGLHPGVKIKVDIMLTDQIIENTISFNNDIGFISYPIQDDKLSIHEVIEDELVLILSPDHPLASKDYITPADLKKQVIIMHEESSAIRKVLLTYMAKDNIQIITSVEYSNNEAIKRAVEMNAGVAMISKLVAEKEIKRGELKAVPLSKPSKLRKFYLIHHKDKYIFKGLDCLLDTLKVWKSDVNSNVLI